MNRISQFEGRKGATRKADVPKGVLRALNRGEIETVNLMEWLALDMSALAKSVARQVQDRRIRRIFRGAAQQMTSKRLLERWMIGGSAVRAAIREEGSGEFYASHASDIVRQWACFAEAAYGTLPEKLRRIERYADDRNMTVREIAWLSVRPDFVRDPGGALRLLKRFAASKNENYRRFAIEGTRPISVWGAHIKEFKRAPQAAEPLLDLVRADESKYVRLAAGNWLNDACKSRPDWVLGICNRWSAASNPNTDFITRRGTRSLKMAKLPLFEDESEAVAA